MKRIFIGLLVLTLAILACSNETLPPSAPEPATLPQTSTRSFGMGVAGLIPRNFPNTTDADWINMYKTLPETGELFGFYTAWSDAPATEGEIPQQVELAFGLAPQYNFTPVIALSYFHDTPDYNVEPNLVLDDPAQREHAVQAAVRVAEKYQPKYLALGIEVNRYFVENPDDYENYVSLYLESYDAVKAVSPQTLVFPVFQYERLRGGVFFQGDGEDQPQWGLIAQFGEKLDLVGFTTYPFLLYDTPADLPDDYYTEISKHTDDPIAFTEMGWPSEPLSVANNSPFGGSESEQSEFISCFFDLTSTVDLEFAMWSFPHDIASNMNPAFTSVSLRENDGTPKPALEVWRSFVEGVQ